MLNQSLFFCGISRLNVSIFLISQGCLKNYLTRKKSQQAQVSRTRVSVMTGRPAMRPLNKLIDSPYPEIYEK